MIEVKDTAYHHWRNRLHERPVLVVRFDAGPRTGWRFGQFAPSIQASFSRRFPRLGNPDMELGRVLAEICLALQREKFDLPEGCGSERDAFWFPAPDQQFAIRTARVSADFAGHLANTPQIAPKNLADSFRNFENLVEQNALDQSVLAMIRVAEARGIPWFRIAGARRDVQFGHGSRQGHMHETLRSNESVIGVGLVQDKAMTCAMIEAIGLPVGRYGLARSADEAVLAARAIGFPVVLKPNTGRKGADVVIGLTDEAAVRNAATRILPKWRALLVQSFIAGDDHRMLVADGKLVAVARRDPASVTGDGVTSVAGLVETANRDPRRGDGFQKLLNLIALDEAAVEVLREQGLALAAVPAKGRVVRLRKNANMSTGGTAVDLTDRVHPDNARLAVRATLAMGLRVAGIDFLSPDISRSWHEVGGGICEVNAGIGLRAHWASNPDRDVVTPIFDMLFAPGNDGRIPTVLVTGSNGKTTTVRMVARILTAAGHVTGMVTTDEVTIDGEKLADDDLAGPTGAAMVLRDPTVTAAVLETARGGVIRRGIYVDRCDVAALLNVQEEQIGMNGVETLADLAQVKAKVAETGKMAVLNAEDEACVRIAATRPAESVILFSLDARAPALAAHRTAGGTGVTTAMIDGNEWIVVAGPAGESPLVAVAELPATFGGAVRVNVANALAAAAIAHAMKIEPATIAAALRGFEPSVERSPGRMNLLTHYPVNVLIDYGHNAPGLKAVVADIARLHLPGRRICLFSVPGDRPDGQIVASGRAVAGHFDHYICFEEAEWRRGRPIGDTIRHLSAGLVEGGVEPRSIGSATSQAEALAQAVALTADGDTLLLFGGEHDKAIPQLDAIFATPRPAPS